MEYNLKNKPVFRIILSVLSVLVISTILMGCLSSNNSSNQVSQISSTNSNVQTTKMPSSNTQSTASVITATNASTSETTTMAQQVQNTIANIVPNGTYSNLEQYAYHSGVNTVNITVTVQNEIVTSASVVGQNVDPYSQYMIGNFNSALPSLVVGQKIESIQLPTNVAGSSLTTAAFQSYINSIVSTKGNPT